MPGLTAGHYFCICHRVMKRFFLMLATVTAVLSVASCTKGYFSRFVEGVSLGEKDALGGDAPGDGQGGGSLAGLVTAGEWNDLAHWPFWSNLMLSQAGKDQEGEAVDFSGMSDYWKFYTNNRVAVCVKDGTGAPVAGAKVALLRGGEALWKAVTDNAGRADLWVSLYQKEDLADNAGLSLLVEGQAVAEAPVVSPWDAAADVTVNQVVLAAQPSVTMQADIAFIVDATGSMADEIDFLKDDLLDVLNRTTGQQGNIALRTAALFYRDKGDTYLTRDSDFSADAGTTVDFIKQQSANGGGDYPEAVHTALEVSLESLAWAQDARTKLAFMLLDAPAHHDDKGVVESLQQSIRAYAEKGIRLIPVASSGVDKDTEFMLRFFAIATGGTYVFLTNDSGVGGDHITATVGEYQVEYLGDLLVRLIGQFTR